MRTLYLSLSLLPTAAVVVLAWFVARAVSIRVRWRESDPRSLDEA
jgi:hypothetical protein